MRKEKKIPATVIIERLGKRLNYPINRAHLATLVHCWTKKHPDEAPTFGTLRIRKKRDGFLWFSAQEVRDLSAYAGYDMTED